MKTCYFIPIFFLGMTAYACNPIQSHKDQDGQKHESGKVLVSQNGFDGTEARLRKAIADRNLEVFHVVDHSRAAQSVGQNLEHNKLFLFGSPKVGTALMQQNPSMGLELPMRALIYNHNGEIHVRVTDIKSLATAYGLDVESGAVPNVALALDMIAREATQ